MARYALLIQYFGTCLAGSQRQANAQTVQGEIEKALAIFFRCPLKLILASRTDAGVHARGMIGHVDLPDELVPGDIRLLCLHLNGILRPDISVLDGRRVSPNFHARNQATSRTYQYRLRVYGLRHPLDCGMVAEIPEKLKLSDLNALASQLSGSHDFSVLARRTTSRSHPVCHITESYWHETEDGVYTYRITADHFLYRMIRTIVGTKISLLSGRIRNLSFENVLKGSRGEKTSEESQIFPILLGPSAPAKGLCLEKITYPATLF